MTRIFLVSLLTIYSCFSSTNIFASNDTVQINCPNTHLPVFDNARKRSNPYDIARRCEVFLTEIISKDDYILRLKSLTPDDINQNEYLKRFLLSLIAQSVAKDDYEQAFNYVEDHAELIIDLAVMGDSGFIEVLFYFSNLYIQCSSCDLVRDRSIDFDLDEKLDQLNDSNRLMFEYELGLKEFENIENKIEINELYSQTKKRFLLDHLKLQTERADDTSQTAEIIINLLRDEVKSGKKNYFIGFIDFIFATNVTYYLLNSDHELEGAQIIQLFEAYYMKIDRESWDEISQYLPEFSMLILNKSALRSQTVSLTKEEIIADREYLIEYYQEKIWGEEDEAYAYASDIFELTALYSDLALNLSYIGACNEAIPFFDRTFKIYEVWEDHIVDLAIRGAEHGPHEDLLTEPVYAAYCALKEGDYSLAKRYLDFSSEKRDLMKEIIFFHPVKLAHWKAVNIQYQILTGDYNKAIESYNTFVDEYSDRERSFPTESQPMEYLNMVINITFMNFELLSKYFDEVLIEDPLRIYNLKFYLDEVEQLENIVITQVNEKVKNAETKFIQITKKARELEESMMDEFSIELLEDLEKINKEKVNVIEEIYSLNSNIKELVKPSLSSIETLRTETLDSRYILIMNSSPHETISILISQGDVSVFSSSWNSTDVKNKIKQLRSYLTIEAEVDTLGYDFSLANEIYMNLFQEPFSSIKKNSTIILYGNEMNGFPMSSLTRNTPENKTFIENFYDAEWLLFDYSFAYYYPTRLTSKKSSYENNFLGFANPSFDDELSLPQLQSTQDEILSMAMASEGERENIFLGNRATRSNFIDSLKSSYNRIAIGTHSISKSPANKITEPSLIFSGNDDQILKASDIANLSVKADLVILSACNTVIDFDSYEFSVLPKAFLVAGSRAVIFSNWNIETVSASEVSRYLFQEMWIDQSSSYEQALRSALIKLLQQPKNKDFIHPSYWAGYSLAYNDSIAKN